MNNGSNDRVNVNNGAVGGGGGGGNLAPTGDAQPATDDPSSNLDELVRLASNIPLPPAPPLHPAPRVLAIRPLAPPPSTPPPSVPLKKSKNPPKGHGICGGTLDHECSQALVSKPIASTGEDSSTLEEYERGQVPFHGSADFQTTPGRSHLARIPHMIDLLSSADGSRHSDSDLPPLAPPPSASLTKIKEWLKSHDLFSSILRDDESSIELVSQWIARGVGESSSLKDYQRSLDQLPAEAFASMRTPSLLNVRQGMEPFSDSDENGNDETPTCCRPS